MLIATQTTSSDLVRLPSGPSPALVDLVAEATEFGRAARSPRTRAAYDSDWADFVSFCTEHDLEPLPADPATVALYVTDRSATLRPSTLTRRAAAISVRHGEAGLPSPTTDPRVRAVLSGIRRTYGVERHQAQPAMLGEIQRMVAHLPDDLIGVRDRAVLLVGFAGGLRRSEIVALNVGDLSPHHDGLVATIRRSKTDQEGRGRKIALPHGHHDHTSPVAALERWREAADITRGALFRAVDRHGNISARRLSAQGVGLIVKRAAERAGLDPANYSGHSLRAGFITTAAINGASERTIAAQTGHRSMEVLRGYIRPATVFQDNAVNRLGL